MHNDNFRFRLFDKKTNSYNDTYVDDACFNMNGDMFINYYCKGEYCTDSIGEYDEDRFIFERCSAKKDKNGKFIFENDILTCCECKVSFQVIFDNTTNKLKLFNIYLGYVYFDDVYTDQMEITGNMHQDNLDEIFGKNKYLKIKN